MRLDGAITKINILLSLSTIFLSCYLGLTIMQPYRPEALSSDKLKIDPAGLINNELTSMLREAYAFDENIFMKKQLFGKSTKKIISTTKAGFIILGISVGDKNLAMIRDVSDNKDYYCVEGDRIGAFRVKQIQRDKVILESEGKILEINR